MRMTWGEYKTAVQTATGGDIPCELSEICGNRSDDPRADGWYIDPQGAGVFCPGCCEALTDERKTDV